MTWMRQDVGAETVWKNRCHTRSGLVRFFQTVYAQEIDADWPFLFRISGLIIPRVIIAQVRETCHPESRHLYT
jgi:hypothetical protein